MSRLGSPGDPLKTYENRLRRMAARQGLMLKKSRRRDPRALDYRKYWLIQTSTGVLWAGGEEGMDLADVEESLASDPKIQATVVPEPDQVVRDQHPSVDTAALRAPGGLDPGVHR